MQTNLIHQARIPRNHTGWNDDARRELFSFHKKGKGAKEVTQIMLNKDDVTDEEINRTRQQAFKQGVALNSRKKAC